MRKTENVQIRADQHTLGSGILRLSLSSLKCPAARSTMTWKPKSSVADPDPRSGAFLTPGSGMGKKSGSGSGMNNADHIYECLETF
jgi:hypothetical protein